MNEFLHEMMRYFNHRAPLVVFGCCLALFGCFLLWYLPWYLRAMLVYRDAYAAAKRAEGEEATAKKVETDTAVFRHRLPIYGRVFLALGAIAILASNFVAK